MKDSTLRALEIDPAIIDSLSEPVLSELIGFIEYDNQLAGRNVADKDRDSDLNLVREYAGRPVTASFPDS